MTPTTASLDLALSFGLSNSEYDLITGLVGRPLSLTELGMVSVMWSEHCGYKYSRPILGYFKEYAAAQASGGMENAGVVPLGEGWGVCFKVESHNHPSAVEPYQGAATGVGGILRDIFTMGARPIAALNSLRFGPLDAGPETTAEVAERNRHLLEHVVRGIGGYGNCVGVPTVAGEVGFHPRYSGNPLVNAMAIGLVRLDEVATAEASGAGNAVIYLGSRTGKDGIHGASFASTALGEDNADKRPNVQIGDPFAEKLLIEATLEALKTGAVLAIQDMGAAGLTCSTIEMSAKGGVGMEIDLDLVPMREADMTAYELMLSESQERMLAVAKPGRAEEIIDVFHRWGSSAVIIGHVIDEQVVRVRRHGVVEAELYPPTLADECPTYRVIGEPPARFVSDGEKRFDESTDLGSALETLLSAPQIASKEWIYRQYDQQVQTQTVVLPGESDAAVIAIRGTKLGIATKIDGNGLWTYHHPYRGGLLAVAEACRNVACTGARPAALTDGLNFGNPQRPDVYWEFDECVRGIAEASDAMGTPVISGNVSFYNESDLGEILPTPMIGCVGIFADVSKSVALRPAKGDHVALLWYDREISPQVGLGASAYASIVLGDETGWPELPIMGAERRLCDLLADLAELGMLTGAHDVSEGGLAVCLAEIALAGKCGIHIPILQFGGIESEQGVWFGEHPGVVVVTYNQEHHSAIQDQVNQREFRIERIGTVEGDVLKIGTNLEKTFAWTLETLLGFSKNGISARFNS